MFVIKDKKSDLIKFDEYKMLCLFETKKHAEKYFQLLHVDDKKDTEIIEVKCKIKKA